MALIPIENTDMGDTSFNPRLGELPSSPRTHTSVELPKENFENIGAMKKGMGKSKSSLVPVEDVPEKKYESTYKPPKSTGEEVQDWFSKPVQGHQFSWKNVAEGAGTGAALGGAVGAFGGPLSAVGGAAVGGVGGGISSIAGELARSSGKVSEAGALGVELATGGLGSVGLKGTKVGLEALLHYRQRNALKMLKDSLESVKTPRELMSPAEKAVKSRELGIKPEYIPIHSTAAQDFAQKDLKTRLEHIGISPKEGEQASSSVRDALYKVVDRENAAGRPLINSPQYKNFLVDFQRLSKQTNGRIGSKDLKEVKGTLNQATSKDPKITEGFAKRLNNLIQNSGQYEDKEGKVVKTISDETAGLLRKHFDDYLKNIPGNQIDYETLKEVEKTEIQSKAIDSIPNLLFSEFKDIKSQKFKDDVANIRAYGPEGRQMLRDAVYQHFFDVKPEKMMQELNRLSGPLKDTKAMSGPQLNQLQETLRKIPKEIPKERYRRFAQEIIRNAFMDAASAETGYRMGRGSTGTF